MNEVDDYLQAQNCYKFPSLLIVNSGHKIYPSLIQTLNREQRTRINPERLFNGLGILLVSLGFFIVSFKHTSGAMVAARLGINPSISYICVLPNSSKIKIIMKFKFIDSVFWMNSSHHLERCYRLAG